MINTIAIKDADTDELLILTRRVSDDTAWTDAQSVFLEYMDRVYEDYAEGTSKDFVVFFKSDDVPPGREVLPPSSMVATLTVKKLITRRSVMGAPEWDYSEEIFPYQHELSNHTELPAGAFPSRSELKSRTPDPVRALLEIKTRIAANPAFGGSRESVTLREAFGFRKDHTLFRGLHDGLVAYTRLFDRINDVENEWLEPRSCCLGVLACKWICFKESNNLNQLRPEKEHMISYFNRVAPGFIHWEGDLLNLHEEEETEILKKAAWVTEMFDSDLWSMLLLNCLYDELRLFKDLLYFDATDTTFLAHGVFHEVKKEDYRHLAEFIEDVIDGYSHFALPDATLIDEEICEKARQELELFYHNMERKHGVEFDFLRRIHVL